VNLYDGLHTKLIDSIELHNQMILTQIRPNLLLSFTIESITLLWTNVLTNININRILFATKGKGLNNNVILILLLALHISLPP